MADIQIIEGSWVLDGADKGGFNKRMDSNYPSSWRVPAYLQNLWGNKKKFKKVADYYWDDLSHIQNFPSVNEIYLQRQI